MFTYDLLIIYKDGKEKVVKNVENYRVKAETGCFEYEKNNYRSFVPIKSVRFFGREFDYVN